MTNLVHMIGFGLFKYAFHGRLYAQNAYFNTVKPICQVRHELF